MNRLLRSSRGASLVEYGILTGLISVLSIGAVLNMGRETRTAFASPASILDWYVGGVTEDFAARYKFTSAVNPDETSLIGFNLDGLSGTPFGALDEATFDVFNLRSLQYDAGAGELSIVMSENTKTATPGYLMSCTDLATGQTPFTVDFDDVTGMYLSWATSTFCAVNLPEAPFEVGRELACVMQQK